MDESVSASTCRSLELEPLDQTEEAKLFESAIRNVLIPSGDRVDLGKVESTNEIAEDQEDPETLRSGRRRAIGWPRAGAQRGDDRRHDVVSSNAGDRRLEEVELRRLLSHWLPL